MDERLIIVFAINKSGRRMYGRFWKNSERRMSFCSDVCIDDDVWRHLFGIFILTFQAC